MADLVLADVARLPSVPVGTWAALGRRFRAIGFTATAAVPFARLATLGPDPRRASMAKWHLRRLHEPHALAMRMMMFCDPVTPEQARAVLGPEVPLEAMLDAGLLVPDGDGVVSPFVMQLLPDLYVLSDDLRAGGDAVMGASPSTKSLAVVARPRGRAGAALDLGCGAGTLALAMASKCERVVATDVSERAVTLARVNVELNGLSNVECRAGDAYQPVQGERFDLVACQPPYVAREETAGATTFLFGGPRGDEVAMRMVGGLREHLAPGGLAFFMVEWPLVETDAPIDERIVEALASPELTLLLLQSPPGQLEEHCARYASIAHPGLGEDYEQAAMRRRDHFERMRIRALQPSVAVVRRGAADLAWASVVDVGNTPMSRAKVEAMLAARDLLGRGEDAVLAARLRAPDKAPAVTGPLLEAVARAGSVGAAVEELSRALDRPSADVRKEALELVTQALLSGQLEVTVA